MSASGPPRDQGINSAPITKASLKQRRAALDRGEENLARAISKFSQAIVGDPEKLKSLIRTFAIEIFDSYAHAYLALVSDEAELRRFYLPKLQRLSRRTIAKVDLVVSNDPESWPEMRKKTTLNLLESALLGRQHDWKAQAMKQLRESKERKSAQNTVGRMQTEGQQKATTSLPGPLAGGGPESRSELGEKKKRGRPQTRSDSKKAEAAQLKAAGGTNRQAAALIYETQYPTTQQVKNVPSILRHFHKKSKQSDSSVKPRQATPKPHKIRG